jgi:dimethyl sulfoxide reductase membrane subunit
MATTVSTEKRELRFDGWALAQAILAVLAVMGFGAWIYQLNSGLVVTNLNNAVVWGLYITLFMFFVGLSAGGLIVASSGEVFGARHLKPLAPFAIWLSFITIGLAAVSIIPDLGAPQRIWRLFVNSQWASPFMWDLAIILFYLVLSGIYLWLHVQENVKGAVTEVYKKWVRRVAFIALPAAVLVHSITAWIFGLQIARPYWYSALLAPFFISSALVSGLGLVILAALLARRLKVLAFENRLISWLGGLLATFIAVDFFFLSAEMLTRLYPGAQGETASALALLTGRFAPLFWTEVILGLIIPFALLVGARARKSMSLVGLAAGLAIIGIFLKRFTLLMAAFTYPYEHFPAGISVGQVLPGLSGPEYVQMVNSGAHTMSYPYVPAWPEVMIVVGMLAAGAFVWLLGIRRIRMQAEVKAD